jgi:hypothetical protein
MRELGPPPDILLTIFDFWVDALRFTGTSIPPRCSLVPEDPFLWEELALPRSARSNLVGLRLLSI